MAGQDAWGTQFKRETNTPGTFEVVANITDIKGPSREREAIEVTAHDSPDQYREFVKGLKDGGEVIVVDADRPTRRHGIPPALLKCEFAAVGLDQVRFAPIAGTDGYFAAFVARSPRPEPSAIRACRA